MAIAFELQVNFEPPGAGEPFFDYVNDRLQPVSIGAKTIGIHSARGTFANPDRVPIYTVSIVPKGVGHGVSFDDDNDRVRLDRREILELSLYLYDCLRGAPQYVGAFVGWEVTGLDPVEYAKEGSTLEGLVVHNAFKEHLGEEWEVFDENHYWIPLTEMDVF